MHKLNPTIPSQIWVTLMLRSIVAIQNSAITNFRIKNELAGFWTLLNLRLQSFYWICCYFIYFSRRSKSVFLGWKSYSRILKEFRTKYGKFVLLGRSGLMKSWNSTWMNLHNYDTNKIIRQVGTQVDLAQTLLMQIMLRTGEFPSFKVNNKFKNKIIYLNYFTELLLAVCVQHYWCTSASTLIALQLAIINCLLLST